MAKKGTKQYYSEKIESLIKGREKLRLEYGITASSLFVGKKPDEYIKQSHAYAAEISRLKKLLERMEQTTAKMIAIGNCVAIFTGVNVRGCGGKQAWNGTKLKQAKQIFYKCCLENGVSAGELRGYVGASRASQPAEYRKEYNASLRSNKEEKQLYMNFLSYLSSLKGEAI